MKTPTDSIERDAVISSDLIYRYTLTRKFGPFARFVTFVMLNPSTADANIDDATIRKCMGFAKRWEFGGIRVVNLYAFRTTYPKELKAAHKKGIDIIGDHNDDYIYKATLESADRVVLAWGNNAKDWPIYIRKVVKEITDRCQEVYHLGLTKGGHPKHPLMLPYATPITKWIVSASEKIEENLRILLKKKKMAQLNGSSKEAIDGIQAKITDLSRGFIDHHRDKLHEDKKSKFNILDGGQS